MFLLQECVHVFGCGERKSLRGDNSGAAHHWRTFLCSACWSPANSNFICFPDKKNCWVIVNCLRPQYGIGMNRSQWDYPHWDCWGGAGVKGSICFFVGALLTWWTVRKWVISSLWNRNNQDDTRHVKVMLGHVIIHSLFVHFIERFLSRWRSDAYSSMAPLNNFPFLMSSLGFVASFFWHVRILQVVSWFYDSLWHFGI